jgi:dUTPase
MNVNLVFTHPNVELLKEFFPRSSIYELRNPVDIILEPKASQLINLHMIMQIDAPYLGFIAGGVHDWFETLQAVHPAESSKNLFVTVCNKLDQPKLLARGTKIAVIMFLQTAYPSFNLVGRNFDQDLS